MSKKSYFNVTGNGVLQFINANDILEAELLVYPTDDGYYSYKIKHFYTLDASATNLGKIEKKVLTAWKNMSNAFFNTIFDFE